jgi:hypothetical protein
MCVLVLLTCAVLGSPASALRVLDDQELADAAVGYDKWTGNLYCNHNYGSCCKIDNKTDSECKEWIAEAEKQREDPYWTHRCLRRGYWYKMCCPYGSGTACDPPEPDAIMEYKCCEWEIFPDSSCDLEDQLWLELYGAVSAHDGYSVICCQDQGGASNCCWDPCGGP